MIFLIQLFTVVLALCVIGLLLIPLAATCAPTKEFRKLERERRGQKTLRAGK